MYDRNSRLSLHSEFKHVRTFPYGLATILFTERDNVLHGKNNSWITGCSYAVLRFPKAETPMKWQFIQVSNKWFIVKVSIHRNSEEDEQSGTGRTGIEGWLWIQDSSKASATDFCEFLLVGDSAIPCVSATLSTHCCVAFLPSTQCFFSASYVLLTHNLAYS